MNVNVCDVWFRDNRAHNTSNNQWMLFNFVVTTVPIKVWIINTDPIITEGVKVIKSELQQIPLHVPPAHYNTLLRISL